MAFTSAAQNTSAASGASNANWKASGFINLYLPAKDGKRRKLGAIALRESKESEKQLLEWLNEDPARVQVIMDKLIMEYQSAAPDEKHAFDLG